MNFREIKWEDIHWIEPFIGENQYHSSEYCFSNLYNWRNIYKTQVAQTEGYGVVRSAAAGGSYLYPFGKGPVKPVIEAMLEDCSVRNSHFCMFGVPQQAAQQLEELFPGRFEFQYDRDHCDYLYTTQKLGELKGKKLHAKRSHINKFKSLYPDWQYQPITPENLPLCHQLNQQWYKEKKPESAVGLSNERHAVEQALEHFWGEGLQGGILWAGSQMAGYSFGKPLNDNVFIVHAEKAFPQIQGAYPMLNQQFVLHHCAGYQYVNREDDTGAEGLRKAKLSYYPDILLEKYIVRLKGE